LKCSEIKDKEIAKLIRVSKRMGTCLFIKDMDDSPCKTALKKIILLRFTDLSKEDIHIVIKEIEGWYLAGASSGIETTLGIKLDDINTNTITKETFLSLKPMKMTKTAFYGMFLKNYDIEKAKARNESFKRFVEKCTSQSQN
jgi:hypothetical protein